MTINSWTEDYGDSQFLDYDLSQLKRDEYYLTVINNSSRNILYLYQQYEECYRVRRQICNICKHTDTITVFQCLYNYVTSFSANYTSIQSSEHKQLYEIRTNSTSVLCNINGDFGEFGVYSIHVNDDSCRTETLKDAVNIYIREYTSSWYHVTSCKKIIFVLAIFTVFLIYTAIFGIIYFLGYGWRKIKRNHSNSGGTKPKRERVKSLDTFRG